ncbi:MAG: sensor domain-containing diguanylate cyclase [Candidatus Thiodiazotropha endolucinida]
MDQESDSKSEWHNDFSMKRALLVSFLQVFIPISVLFCGIFYIFSNQTQKYELQTIKIREESALKSASALTSTLFKQKLSDLLVLVEGEIMRQYLHNDNIQTWTQVTREFSLLARRKPKYVQIRLMDTDGKEVVRVNNKNEGPNIVPKSQLQDKSDRYYFKEAITFNQGDIYISPLDLNMEQGVIEEPIVPTIRFATPVYDGYGTKRGILIINYTPAELLDKIEDIFDTLAGDTIMLNSDGYWLMGVDDEKLWGFMYGSEETFSSEQPEVWKAIEKNKNGSVTTDTGLYIFQRAYPLNRAGLGSVENIQLRPDADQPRRQDLYWIYVSHISKELLNDLSSIPIYISTIIYLLQFITIGLISGVFAKKAVKKKFASIKLQQHATTDELTGLSNRRELHKTAEMEFKRAYRFNRDYSILMIDLDNFKEINDSYGHSMGDEVLKHNANICLNSTRTEDLLARYGGEEFVMLLPETNIEGARQLAERICQDVREQPFDSGRGPIAVTVSIGVSEIDPDDISYSNILERADTALYQAKREGRNRVATV